MTKSFSVNKYNDIFIGLDGNLSIASGVAAVQYAAENYALAQRGEMPLDATEGLPNFATVWVGVPNLSQFEAALRATIAAVPGVQQILSYTATVDDGVLSYTVVILTDFGRGVVNGASAI